MTPKTRNNIEFHEPRWYIGITNYVTFRNVHTLHSDANSMKEAYNVVRKMEL